MRNFEISVLDTTFKNIIKALDESNRDISLPGRINEFTRVITINVFEFTEFIERVLKGEIIEAESINYYKEKLEFAAKELDKLKRIVEEA